MDLDAVLSLRSFPINHTVVHFYLKEGHSFPFFLSLLHHHEIEVGGTIGTPVSKLDYCTDSFVETDL